jgi:hypothetical protein
MDACANEAGVFVGGAAVGVLLGVAVLGRVGVGLAVAVHVGRRVAVGVAVGGCGPLTIFRPTEHPRMPRATTHAVVTTMAANPDLSRKGLSASDILLSDDALSISVQEVVPSGSLSLPAHPGRWP